MNKLTPQPNENLTLMQLYYPEKHRTALEERLQTQPAPWLLVCFCAAWCRTCAGFEQALEDFAQQNSELVCIWVDIETHEALLLEEDLDNLPTFLLQQDGQSVFYAPLPPQVGHLQRLYEQAQQGLLPPISELPDFSAKLRALTD